MRIYKHRTDYVLFGICGCLGKESGLDPMAIRLVLVLLALFGSALWVPLPAVILVAYVFLALAAMDGP